MTADADTGLTPHEVRLAEEYERQHRVARDEAKVRFPALALAYAMTMIYLPVWIVLAMAAIEAAGEAVVWRLLGGDRARLARDPARRRLLLAGIALMQLGYGLPCALMWHLDDPYAKALAVGMLVSGMMHLATTRAINLATGMTGWVVLTAIMVVGNAHFWVPTGDWLPLFLTTLTGAGGCAYFASALMANHRLHREALAGRRVAQAADAAKGRFLTQVSHELRTPLNAIVGLSHAELGHATDAGTIERLSVMVASAEELSRLLDDILDLSAIEAGRLPVRPARADPAAEIAASAALWRPAIEQCGLALTVEVAGDLGGPALLDRERLRQCLSNLLSNALRHTPSGGITMQAAATWQDGQRGLEVTVIDTGPGVAADLRERLFEPFSGAGPDPARGGAGHGIGLSIARATARAMGGDLVLDPGPEAAQGARFRLSLPLPDAPGDSPPVLPPVPGRALAGRRVLVVDDVGTNRMVAAACLRLLGAEPGEAGSGAAALAAVGADRWDAVLLDMNMPGMDGLETLRRLRALPGAAGRLPVVAMTADAMPGLRTQYLAAGLDGYLAKPVSPERLADALAAVLARREA